MTFRQIMTIGLFLVNKKYDKIFNMSKWNKLLKVDKQAEYFISVSNYVNNEGLVAIEIVDNPVVDVSKKASITKYNQY